MKSLKGKKVRLRLGQSTRPGPRRVATIISEFKTIPGGVTISPKLDGFKSWNMDALEIVS